MHVGIDTDAQLPKSLSYHEIGGFSPHAFQFHQCVYGIGDLPVVFPDESFTDIMDSLGFGPVESGRVDGLLNNRDGKLNHLFWGVRQGEEPQGSLSRYIIFCSQTDEGGNQDGEGRPSFPGHFRYNGFFELFDEFPESCDKFPDLFVGHQASPIDLA